MKKILIFLSSLALGMCAKQTLVNVPTSQAFYVDTSMQTCDKYCLYELLYDGAYLSFLARFKATDDEKLFNYYSKLLNGIDYLNIPKKARSKDIKIAVVIPEEVIKSYSSNIISPVLAYLINKKSNATLKVYYTGKEIVNDELINALKPYNLIITGFRGAALNQLASALNRSTIYSPLEAHGDGSLSNVYYGKVDYNEQIAKLMSVAAPRVGIFGDTSALSGELSASVASAANVVFKRVIDPKDYNVASALAGANALNNASVFFNMPLVKTTLLATQLHSYNVRAKNFLSTQINYHPMFLSLAQENERNKFYFASIIGKIDPNVEYINEILGQKISYNWIAYATSAGLDSLYAQLFDTNEPRLFEENFSGKKLEFKTKIMSAKNSKFSEVQ